MRSVVPVAILMLTSFVLAGCAKDGGDDDLHYVCANGTEIHADDHPEANATKAEDLAKFCPKSTTSGSRSNTTSSAPNVMPDLVLNITDAGGNATNVVMLDGNLTISAEGSSDSDGTVAGIAVTVTDSNTTRTATLYDAGKKQFQSATFTFDRAGIVNVTVAMVDDRAGFTINQTHIYVNQVITGGPNGMQGAGGDRVAEEDCTSAPFEPLVRTQVYWEPTFTVVANASWIEATVSDDAPFTICGPRADPSAEMSAGPTLSEVRATGTVQTIPGIELPTPVGIQNYYLAVWSPGPQSNLEMTVTVHYEPDTRAAAPA